MNYDLHKVNILATNLTNFHELFVKIREISGKLSLKYEKHIA